MYRGAFALITNQAGSVLLVRSITDPKYLNVWSIPGGVVEDDETYEQAAVRETLEEVGLVINLGARLSIVESIENNITAATFKASYVSGALQVQAHEIEAAQWFSIKEAKELNLGFNIRELIEGIEKEAETAKAVNISHTI